MRFLDREHFTPHFFSEKRQGTVTGAVATLLGTLLGVCFGTECLVFLGKVKTYSSTMRLLMTSSFAPK